MGQINNLNGQHKSEKVLHKIDWIVYYATNMHYVDYLRNIKKTSDVSNLSTMHTANTFIF